MQTTISIIIATFNASNILRRALESVINQTFNNWECIIIDGASTDSTLEIIQSYCKKDSRFSYLSEIDRGIYDAYNKGWKKAKGDWIYYLGADDKITPDAFEILSHNITEDSEILYGNIIYDSPRGLIYKKSTINTDKIRHHIITSHQAFFMKRELFDKYNGFDLSFRNAADYDLLLRCYMDKVTIKYVDCYISIFNTSGVSSSQGWVSIKDTYRLRKKNKSVNCLTNIIIASNDFIIMELRRMLIPLYLLLKRKSK